MLSTFESSSRSRKDFGKRRGSRTTAAATTGPASGPRPASSTPQTSPVQRRSILKSGIALSPKALCHKGCRPGKAAQHVAGARPRARYLSRMLRFALAVVFTLSTAVLLAPAPSAAFDLFATHEVAVQFATPDGKPLANAEVQVVPPVDPKTPVITGPTDPDGKLVFE